MTSGGPGAHDELIKRVGIQLGSMSTATDHLLLTRWRVLGLCQFLIGGGREEVVELSVSAIDLFIREGPSRRTDAAFRQARNAIARSGAALTGSVLPTITPEKQKEVRARLEAYEAQGASTVTQAIAVLPSLRDRLQRSPMSALLAGLRHRLELVAALVTDGARSLGERQRSAAAILYLDEFNDAIPDTLVYTGLLDDDFALRLVLSEFDKYTEDERLHWAERITALWDDLPFLQGVHLEHQKGPSATTWLDRVNSYVSYSHALDGAEKLLILVQPSVACSPLHSIVSLIGLLVLDGLTSSRDLLDSLSPGHVYEIDGQFYAMYEGIDSGPRAPGWLRLRFREGIVCRPPAMADRMVAVGERPLSSSKAFGRQEILDNAEPIQKFFAWDDAIGAASITSRVLLVTSRQRAMELLGGVRSNGVSLIEDGLVRFAGISPSADLVRAGLVLVIPTVTVARQLMDQGVGAHAILVDGYERLHRGRHDLEFLLMHPSPPPIIVWSATGYYPDEPPSWLPRHRRLQVAADDLPSILELDGDLDEAAAPSLASLWEAATASGVEKIHAPGTTSEQAVLASIDDFMRIVRSSGELPDYWKYQLASSATRLRTLVAATPAYWNDIREMEGSWEIAFRQQWDALRQGATEQLAPLMQTFDTMTVEVAHVSAKQNSKADALIAFLDSSEEKAWHIVCDRSEQVKMAGRFCRRHGVEKAKPVLLRDLRVCKSCIVVGWRSASFGRRLAAHTPQRLVALVEDSEGKRWDRLQAQPGRSKGESLLEAIGHVRTPRPVSPVPLAAEPDDDEPEWLDDGHVVEATNRSLRCVFIWLSGEREGKVLATDSRVLVEVGEHANEKPACRIVPEDRVILGAGVGRWSPADEFTGAVVDAIESSHPELIRDVREWRRALKQLQEDRGWSIEDLRDRLTEAGVRRELQTLDGWLRVEQASPIGPQHLRRELTAMWSLLDAYTDRAADDVMAACSRLRSLRLAAGRTLLKLWKGGTVDLGIDDARLEDLVDRLRQEVQVHEVDAVTFGEIPEAMLGWWVTPDLAERYSTERAVDNAQEGHEEAEGDV